MAVLTNATEKLSIPTYDGTTSHIHPSVVDFTSLGLPPWNGFRFWMAFTPFTLNSRERPSIVASHNGSDWEVPPNVTNPIAGPWEALDDTPPAGGGSCLTNDPSLVYDPVADALICYYGYINDVPGVGRVGRTGLYRKTFDGTTVSGEPCYEGESALSILGLGGGSVVVHRESVSLWHMWLTGADRILYRTSSDGVAWGATTECTLTRPAFMDGFKLNHIGGRYNLATGKMEITVSCYDAAQIDEGGTFEHVALLNCDMNRPTQLRSVLSDWLIAPGTSGGWDGKSLYRTEIMGNDARGVRKVWYSAYAGVPLAPIFAPVDCGIGFIRRSTIQNDPVMSTYGIPGLVADYRVTSLGEIRDAVGGGIATIIGNGGILPNVQRYSGGNGFQGVIDSSVLVTIPTAGFDYTALTIVLIVGLNWQTAGVKQLLGLAPTATNANKVDFYQASAGAAVNCDFYGANAVVVSRASATIQSANGTNLMCACLWNPTQILAYQSEDGLTAAFATDAMDGIAPSMYIGSNVLGTSKINGPLHRVMVFNRTLTAAEFTTLESALDGTVSTAVIGTAMSGQGVRSI